MTLETGRRVAPSRPGFRPLSIGVILAFAVTMGLSVLVPIYNDEVGWKIITTRFLLDGGTMISLFPRCDATFLTDPPWFMVPVRIAEAWTYADLSLFQIRAMGVLSLGLWVAVTLALLARIARPVLPGVRLPAVILGVLGFGALPFLLVINRPEQPLLIGLTLLLLVPLVLPGTRGRWTDAAAMLGVLLVSAVLFASHPKSLVFMPLILVALFLTARAWWSRAAGTAGLTLLAAQTYAFWTHFNACPGDPAFHRFLAEQMVTLGELASDPLGTGREIVKNLINIPYYGHALKVPVGLPMPWLPPFPDIPRWLADAVTLAIRIILAGGVAIAAWAVLTRLRRSWRERRPDPRLLLSLACFLSLIALSGLQTVKHFYEIGLVGPLAVVATLVALPPPRRPFAARAGRAYAVALMVVSLVSQLVLWTAMLSRPLDYYVAGGYLPEQERISVSPYRYGAQAAKIRATARACQIDLDRRPRHLVTDDLTYPALVDSYLPFNIFYIERGSRWPEARLSGAELLEFLRAWRSEGLVVGCHMLPAELRGAAVRVGDFCCMRSFGSARLAEQDRSTLGKR